MSLLDTVQNILSQSKPGCSVTSVSESGEAQVITFDATISQSHDGESDITDQPIEKGADLSDHVRPMPRTLDLEVLVTDYPLSVRGGGIGEPGFTGRAQGIFDTLDKMREDATECRVVTRLRTYDSMLVKAVRTVVDNKLKKALRLQITFKRVTIATSQSVPVQVAANRTGQSSASKGPQQTTQPTANQSKSFLASGVDFTANLFK